MLFHLLAHRQKRAIFAMGFERRDIGRRRRRRGAQEILQNPLATLHHRGPVGIGRDGEDAALSEQAAAALALQRYPAELRAIDIRGCRSAAPDALLRYG